MSRVATYVYCLLRARRAPALRGALGGLPGCGPPRMVDAGEGAWLVVADAPLSRYGQAALDAAFGDIEWVSRCAIAHERVIEHFSTAPSVLPMKLFTLFASDARAAGFVSDRRRQLERLLDRVEDRREWSVRVTLDAARAAAALASSTGERRPASGTAFLARKQKAKGARADLLEAGRGRADALFRTLGKLAAERKRRADNEAEPGSALLLDAVYLVPRARRARFAAAAKKAGGELLRRGFKLELTGPWPPYHFAA